MDHVLIIKQNLSAGIFNNIIVFCGVRCAAVCAVDRQGVMVLSQNSADDTYQGFSVLLPQETVHKWVCGGLCIGQTFRGDAPVARDVH